MYVMEKYRERFLQVPIEIVGDCRVFKGTINSKGRAVFALRMPGKTRTSSYNASKAAWILFIGEIPNGLHVLHRCKKQPNCVNLNHLYLGTQKDNSQDMINDGTHYFTKQTHCKNGHEWSVANTRYRKTGGRYCRQCERAKAKRLYLKHRDKWLPIKRQKAKERYHAKKKSNKIN